MSNTQPIDERMARYSFPRTPRSVRAFQRGWCAAAGRDVALHPGTDLARVRHAVELEWRGWPEVPPTVKRVFAMGVRAKLQHLRDVGVIA